MRVDRAIGFWEGRDMLAPRVPLSGGHVRTANKLPCVRCRADRLGEFQGAVLRAQLRRLPEQCRTRQLNYDAFLAKIAGLPGIHRRKLRPDAAQRCLSVVIVTFTGEGWDGVHRDTVLEALRAEGVPATLGYGWANYRNPAFLNMQAALGARANAFGVERFPNWLEYAARCPVTEQACRDRAIFMPHALLLGGDDRVQTLADAFEKVYEHRAELLREQRARASADVCSLSH